MMKDLGLLILRLTTGGLVAGHGLQKLVGAFQGPGLEGTTKMMQALGLTPARPWAVGAALAESSGALTALGFLHPLGPLGTISAMAMATAKVHADKPIWSSAGGAELPVTNIGSAVTLLFTGPGRLSIDEIFGIRLPATFVAFATVAAAALVAYGITNSAAQGEGTEDHVREPVQAGVPAE